jgi:hypothetical protein
MEKKCHEKIEKEIQRIKNKDSFGLSKNESAIMNYNSSKNLNVKFQLNLKKRENILKRIDENRIKLEKIDNNLSRLMSKNKY